MPQSLSYGYTKPQAGDLASQWMEALEEAVQQLNDHNHDGANSAPVAAANITKYTSTITNTGYTDDGNGNFSKVITVPAAVTEVNNFIIQVYITSSGVRIYPSIERVSATTWRLRVNSQLALTAVYI